jgi:signal transduction histidine kinase
VAEPNAPSAGTGRADERRRPSVPQSFQTRLTFAFTGIVALTFVLVAPVVVWRLDDFFRQQEEQRLQTRAEATALLLVRSIADEVPSGDAVVHLDPQSGQVMLNPDIGKLLANGGLLQFAAGDIAQADVEVEFGPAQQETDGGWSVDADPSLRFAAHPDVAPAAGEAPDPGITPAVASKGWPNAKEDWGVRVRLSNPYTSRATTLLSINGLLLVMAALALAIAVLVAVFLSGRFATPITRLTDASRRLAEGDLTSRVATDDVSSSTLELRTLSQQFNQMADRLEESVGIIRRDRDRSRDFLADVSHELLTPIAAMRTFVELLQGPAGMDPEARAEFLGSSAAQLDRLDWLAQNLLELSKLDSGLVLLDLRPEDVRGTIESAVEQQLATAERKGIGLTVALPEHPVRIRHDGPRVGQVVSNLVGNALKFTDPGGEVRISARPEPDGGVRIEVADTGVGIQPSELPRIFDRFYRGSEMIEARSEGSGLGLAIVKSIVDMHHGTIAVESRVGQGSRFVVTLPRDPREVTEVEPAQRDAPATTTGDEPAAKALSAPRAPNVDVSSPTADPAMNPDASRLASASGQADHPATNPSERSTQVP